MQLEVLEQVCQEKCLTEVVAITQVDPTTVNGLANVVTASETVIVNGIVGSVLSETGSIRPARKLLKTVHSILGTRVTRFTYRIVEWIVEHGYANTVL